MHGIGLLRPTTPHIVLFAGGLYDISGSDIPASYRSISYPSSNNDINRFSCSTLYKSVVLNAGSEHQEYINEI